MWEALSFKAPEVPILTGRTDLTPHGMMAKALESDLAQARDTGLTRHGVPMFLSA